MTDQLEAVRSEWFSMPTSSTPTPTSPRCSLGEHAACWRGHELPPNTLCWRDARNRRVTRLGVVATFGRGWSANTHQTAARIVSPVEHYTCDCDCHAFGFAGQQLDLFGEVA